MRLLERLDAIDRRFERVLVIGASSTALAEHARIGQAVFADLAGERLPLAKQRIVMDEETLPIADGALDAVISVLSLHAVNDLPGALIQMRRALKPDGLLLAALPGARSLMGLRQVLAESEAQYGGISPRVAPFCDVRDAGNLLQRAGFSLPVVDSERLTLSYESFWHGLKELRGMGETNCLTDRLRHPTPRRVFFDAAEAYVRDYSDHEGRVTAEVELLCLTAWTPHASQQQPARRGSGTVSLRDVLE